MKTIAIIIGISKYQSSAFETISHTQADALRFAASLESWGLPKEWIYLLTNEQASKSAIIQTFYDCRFAFDKEAKLIFYFAGHGIKNCEPIQGIPESSLVCYDTQKTEALETGIRLVELMQLVRMLRPGQTFLFINACSLRLNQIDNFLNEGELLSTTKSKGLFCLFSSGMDKPSQNQHKYGYFTNALLKSLAELRENQKADCRQLAKSVSSYLSLDHHPIPEVYHIGNDEMWPLQESYQHEVTKKRHSSNSLVWRSKALAKLQDFLVSNSDPIIWMWGGGGMGKSILAKQFCDKNPCMVYTSIPNVFNNFIDIIQTIIEQVRSQKGEIFFNRAPDSSLSQTLSHLISQNQDAILIIDHLDRMNFFDLDSLLLEIDKVSLPCLLISRNPFPQKKISHRKKNVIEWLAAPLNVEEIEALVSCYGLDLSYSSVLQKASGGNALKVRQMIVNMSEKDIPIKQELTEEYINTMSAIASCGGFIDEQLFCQIFGIRSRILASFEKLGLIHYTKQGCYPHDMLIDLVEEGNWNPNIEQACHYWHKQIQHTPFNLYACRSMVLLSTQIENYSPFKESLGQCLETLSDRENLHFLIDLVQIFLKAKWEDLLLQASDYLIDHEEYQLSGDVLKELLKSKKKSIRIHASKNDARRLVWLGRHADCIQSYSSTLENCSLPLVAMSLKNNIAIAHYFTGNLNIAMQLLDENINYKGKKDERELGIAKYMAGMILVSRNENLMQAKSYYESSVQIFETTRAYLWNIVALNALGDLSYYLEQWRQSLYYLNKSKDIASTLQNRTFLLAALKNIARVYLKLRGIASQDLAQIAEDIEMLLNKEISSNWATMLAQNVLATVYAYRNDPAKLQIIMDQVTPLSINYKTGYVFTLANLGHLAALKREQKEAQNFYHQSYVLAEELNNHFAMKIIKQDSEAIYQKCFNQNLTLDQVG